MSEVSSAEPVYFWCGRCERTLSDGESEPTAKVALTREELEAVIIGTEASRLKPILHPSRWGHAASAERKLFAALRGMGWDR